MKTQSIETSIQNFIEAHEARRIAFENFELGMESPEQYLAELESTTTRLNRARGWVKAHGIRPAAVLATMA